MQCADANLWALCCVLSTFPMFLGCAEYFLSRSTGNPRRLIVYKGFAQLRVLLFLERVICCPARCWVCSTETDGIDAGAPVFASGTLLAAFRPAGNSFSSSESSNSGFELRWFNTQR